MSRGLIALLCLAWSALLPAADEAVVYSATATPPLQPYAATYTVTRGRMRIGELHAQLSPGENGTWRYRSQARATGVAALLSGLETNELSVFRLDDGLVALHHSYHLAGDRRDRDFTLDFNWNERTVSGTVRGERVHAPVPAGAVDRHAMTIAVMVDLANGRAFPLQRTMVDRARLRVLETTIDGVEHIETRAGRFVTTRIVQQRMDDPTRRYIVWVAALESGWVPVRIRSVDDDGADFTLELTRLER